MENDQNNSININKQLQNNYIYKINNYFSNDPKPEIYYMKSCETHSPGKDSLLVKDETFPELTNADDAESVCSCAERDRDGDAFPKAWERDLVTPTNLEQPENQDNIHTEVHSAEERRKSMLDHHWAIPSKDRSLEGDDTPPPTTAAPLGPIAAPTEQPDTLTKQSCHDSGITISLLLYLCYFPNLITLS